MKTYLLLALLIAPGAFCQPSDSSSTFPEKSHFRRGIITEFGLAGTVTGLSNLRSFFRSNQIRGASIFDLYVSIGGGVRLNRVKILAQYGFGIKDDKAYYDSAQNGNELVARNTLANYSALFVGYDLINTRNRRLYLNAGLGSLEYGYSLFRRSSQPVSFPAILSTSQPGTVPSLLLRNAGYVDVNLEYAQREKKKRSFEYTIRLGYRRGLSARAYESDAFPLVNAPRDRINQWYLQTVFNSSFNGEKLRFR